MKSKKLTKKLIPKLYLEIIQSNKSVIESVVQRSKAGKSPLAQRQLSVRQDKLTALAAYLYERGLNYYWKKRQYKGIPMELIGYIVRLASRKQVKLYLDILQELGLIKRIGKPVKGKSSYDYQPLPVDVFLLNGYGCHGDFVMIEYDYDNHAKIGLKKESRDRDLMLRLESILVDSLSLDIDSANYQEAKKLIYLGKDEEIQKHGKYKIDQDNELKRRNEYFSYLENCYREKIYNVRQGPKNGRISSLISGTSSKIRNLIKLDGECTVSLDFANSQPAILANLIEYQIISGSICETPDLREYINLATTGKLYRHIALKRKPNLISEAEIDHEISNIKTDLWMRGVYGMKSLSVTGDEASPLNKKSLEILKIFPNLIKFLDNMKERNNSYKVVAITLQKLESKLVNGIVAKMVASGLKVIPTYDEFRVKSSDEPAARKIISEHIISIGIKMSIKEHEPYLPLE